MKTKIDRRKVGRFLYDAAAFGVGLVIALLLFVLIYSVMIVACGIDPACAEEMNQYPVAYVDVNAGSCLNVRKTPGGDVTSTRLRCREDVVILAVEGGWALVMRLADMQNGVGMNRTPLGWCSREYLHTYWVYATQKEPPSANWAAN